jgi:hypothetical protein
MTLLDLDAAGLDPSQPAPVEFIQFLYDNSRSQYLTLWSARLGEPDMASKITRWLNDALAVYHARSLQTQIAPVGDKPVGSNVTEVTYAGPTTPAAPVCIDVPYASGAGTAASTLNCTMGNWGNEPSSYAYQWMSGSAEVGDGTSSYLVAESDAGKSVTCIVTATNAGGATGAPPSNAIAIAGAAADASSTKPDTTRSTDERKRDDAPVHRTAPKERTTTRDA